MRTRACNCLSHYYHHHHLVKLNISRRKVKKVFLFDYCFCLSLESKKKTQTSLKFTIQRNYVLKILIKIKFQIIRLRFICKFFQIT